MFFNLLSLILIYLLFFSIVFASGSFANNFFFRFEKLTFGETGILGFVFIYTIILIVHFIIPINDFFIYSIYFLLLFYFFYDLKNILKICKINFKIFSSIFIIFIILSITNNHHDDLYIFQLPIINYMQNYKIIFGFINLNDFIGQGHSFYEIMSFFKIPVYENRVYFLIPIIFLNFFVIYLFEILKIEKNSLVKYFVYFIILLLIIRFNRSKEYGTDLPLLCLLFYIQLNLFQYLNTKNFIYFLKSILAGVFCVILKLYGVLSLFYILAFLPVLKKDFFKILKEKNFLLIIITICLLTLMKNIFVSGCLFYPISKTCFDKNQLSWSIGKEVAEKRAEFYDAQVFGWRSYTKNINNKKFISAREYLDLNISEKIKGLGSDKDLEKILTGLFLSIIFVLILLISKEKIPEQELNKNSNKMIAILLFMPFLIWLLKFPQSRYGFFAYISCFIFYFSFNFFNVGKINKKVSISFFLMLLIFLFSKNFLRINNEINNNLVPKNYPIKKFNEIDYNEKAINNIIINIPKKSFMECSNIPMLCASNINMINNVYIKNGYYFIKNNKSGLLEHINKSAIYDMIETNN